MSQEIKFPGINQGVKNPFRWYLSEKKKNRYRKACENECSYKLLVPSTSLLPFQLYTTLSGTLSLSWNIYDADGNLIASPDSSFLTVAMVENLQYIYYTGADLGFFMPAGFYYSEIIISNGAGSVTWYSEDFYSGGSCDGMEVNPDPNLCTNLFQTSMGSGSYSFSWKQTEPCSICIGASSSDPVIIEYPNLFPTPLSLYKVTIRVDNMPCMASVKLTFGNGDEFTLTEPGEQSFTGYNELGDELKLTLTPNNIPDCACGIQISYISVKTQNIVDLQSCHAMLQWWDYCELIGEIYYGSSGFKNMLFLEDDVELSDPQNKIVQEGILNGEKDFIPQFIRRTSSWTLELGLQPPYIVQALYEMITHANKTISLPSELGGGVSQMINPVINAPYDSEGGGCFATVSLTFETEDTTIVDGCCDGDLPVCEGQPLAGTIEQDSVLCATGGTTSLAATGTSVAPGITYQWEWSVNAGPWNEANSGFGATTPNYTTFDLPTVGGDSYCFRMRTDCFASGLSNYSNEVCVVYDDDDTFTISASSTAPVCSGSNLGLYGIWTGGDPLSNWQWTGPGGYSASGQNVSRSAVTPADSGTYTVTAICIHGCTLTATVEVVINENPALNVDSVVNTSGGLNNGEIHLSVTGGTATYLFDLAYGNIQLTGDYTGLAAGSYDAAVIDDNGCEAAMIIGIVVA